MTLDLQILKDLREKTGVGIADCKAALEEGGGDLQKAIELLRERGHVKAAKKSDRTTSEGLVGVYLHANGKIGAMVKVLCETDFVARSDDFRNFVRDLALHVASENPLYLTLEDVPASVLEKEKAIAIEQLKNEGKPEAMYEKILPGKMNKYFTDVCLFEQYFIKDDKKQIKDLVSDMVLKLGENIQIREFHRLSL